MSDTHRREFSELPLTIDRGADTPLPVQLAGALREAIDGGTLRPGESVPATRELSVRLGVARGVVVAAYRQLIAEGYLAAGHGRGTRVHPQLRGPDEGPRPGSGSGKNSGDSEPNSENDRRGSRHTGAPREGSPAGETPDSAFGSARLASVEGDDIAALPRPLTPGLSDTSAVDTPAWRSAWRQALSRAHLEAPSLGDRQLREQISEHLRRMRGTTRTADDIIVTAGAREGLSLLLTALSLHHGRPLVVGVEDPGYPSLRRVAVRHGARIVALPVDEEGLVTARLPMNELDAVVVTPSHQYPLGGSLPLVRRRELLDWASRSGAVIIEDDYDSELRHSGSPLPTLAALDDAVEGSVVLLGTFSKTVSQALAAGFLLAPSGLRQELEPVRRDIGGPVSAVVQTALAEYLASGELRRHTARMRRRYASRRELVVERLFGVPGVRVRPMSGGLHAVITFPGDASVAEQIEAAVAGAGARLGAVPLSAYWQSQSRAEERYGLVIGTGGSLDSEVFASALDELREILLERVPGRGLARRSLR